MARNETGFGWAWEFQGINGEWLICNWCEPSKQMLLNTPLDQRPTDDCRPIRVALVPTSDRARKRYGVK